MGLIDEDIDVWASSLSVYLQCTEVHRASPSK